MQTHLHQISIGLLLYDGGEREEALAEKLKSLIYKRFMVAFFIKSKYNYIDPLLDDREEKDNTCQSLERGRMSVVQI